MFSVTPPGVKPQPNILNVNDTLYVQGFGDNVIPLMRSITPDSMNLGGI